MDTMQILMNKMVKAKGDSGYVVFVKHQSAPGGMLANPVFVQAWTVGRDGIREVIK